MSFPYFLHIPGHFLHIRGFPVDPCGSPGVLRGPMGSVHGTTSCRDHSAVPRAEDLLRGAEECAVNFTRNGGFVHQNSWEFHGKIWEVPIFAIFGKYPCLVIFITDWMCTLILWFLVINGKSQSPPAKDYVSVGYHGLSMINHVFWDIANRKWDIPLEYIYPALKGSV